MTITGTNLAHARAVRFGSTAAVSFIVENRTEIVAVAPPGRGTVRVTVTTPAGTSCDHRYYTYLPAPLVTSISPGSGPASGGTTVTIDGRAFTNATAVDFGSTPASSFTVDGDSQITAVAPAGTGIVDVTVTALGGTSTTSPADQYVYEDPPTVQISAPADNQTYDLDQVVPTSFSCTEGAYGPGILTCTDSNGATGGVGTLDTSTPGPQTYTVTATSQDSQTATTTIDYTVAAPPTAQIESPADGQTYNLNQVVSTTFSCTKGAYDSGLESCTDSNGATDGTGQLDTTTAGQHIYTVTATSQDGQTSASSIHYKVAGPPTATITAPADNQSYNLNQVVPTTFSCTEGTDGSGIQSCTDSNGATNGTGQLDTTTPGQHTYTVTATSQDGQSSASSIHYKVAGPPTATITAPADNQSYSLNQSVPTAFSCTEGIDGPGIETCTDSNGATDGSGQLDTTAPGQHTYTVTATSKDGQDSSTTIRYGVAQPPAQPMVQTGQPTVTVTGAGFSGSVIPNGLPTTAFFQYGLDSRYTTPGTSGPTYTSSTAPASVGSDFSGHPVGPVTVTGLVPNAEYHVRLVASNSAGTVYGPDVTFTTPATPPPRAPTLGATFNVSAVTGIVLVKTNGVFVPLTETIQIHNGAEINARRGFLGLLTATGKKGKTQHGVFGGAIFRLTQQRKGRNKGLVTLAIAENAFHGAPSYAVCRKHPSGDASAASLSRKTLQLLRANAHGKFSTRGRYSSATVRGTIWTVADRCDGTLTHDVTDSVAVTDFVHHKTIILHAGQSYLARPLHPPK